MPQVPLLLCKRHSKTSPTFFGRSFRSKPWPRRPHTVRIQGPGELFEADTSYSVTVFLIRGAMGSSFWVEAVSNSNRSTTQLQSATYIGYILSVC
jgi:hypothetical protein